LRDDFGQYAVAVPALRIGKYILNTAGDTGAHGPVVCASDPQSGGAGDEFCNAAGAGQTRASECAIGCARADDAAAVAICGARARIEPRTWIVLRMREFDRRCGESLREVSSIAGAAGKPECAVGNKGGAICCGAATEPESDSSASRADCGDGDRG